MLLVYHLECIWSLLDSEYSLRAYLRSARLNRLVQFGESGCVWGPASSEHETRRQHEEHPTSLVRSAQKYHPGVFLEADTLHDAFNSAKDRRCLVDDLDGISLKSGNGISLRTRALWASNKLDHVPSGSVLSSKNTQLTLTLVTCNLEFKIYTLHGNTQLHGMRWISHPIVTVIFV